MTQQQQQPFLGDIVGVDDKVLESVNAPTKFDRRTLLVSLTALAGVGAIGYFKGSDIWKIIERDVLEVPAAIRESYREPGATKDVIVDTRNRYPYSKSTMEVYAQEETRLFPERDGAAMAVTIATNIANRVALQARALVRDSLSNDESSYEEAFAELAKTPEGLNSYMKLIAYELIRAGCFYKIEGSLDSAVDSTKHLDSKFHLDCDLLCHVALHCASRHDMPLEGIRAPSHMYIGSPSFDDYAIEMTAFRGEQRTERDGLKRRTFTAIGESYFTTHRSQRLFFQNVSAAESKRLGYFEPLSMDQIQESAVGNLLVELLVESLQKEEPAELAYLCAVADRELRRFQGGELVAQNVYAVHSLTRDYYFNQWRANESNKEAHDRALFHARSIERIKGRYREHLMVTDDRDDKAKLDRLTS